MEDAFKTILFAFIVMTLVGFLAMTSISSVGQTYNRDTTQLTGGAFNMSGFNDTITQIEQNAKNMQESFDKGTIWTSFGLAIVEGIFGIFQSMTLMVKMPFSLLSNIMINVLGVPAFVSSVILGLIIMSIIFAVYRLLKVGT